MTRDPGALGRTDFEQTGVTIVPGVCSDVDVSLMAAAIDAARLTETARYRRRDFYGSSRNFETTTYCTQNVGLCVARDPGGIH